MKNVIVTRHPGAITFLKSKGVMGIITTNIDVNMLEPGDKVYGKLPIYLIESILNKECQFFLLELPFVPPEMKARELSAGQLMEWGARIYEVKKLELRLLDLSKEVLE